ncbi:hypothetical protein [Streptomyces violaceusniger]|uniref:hypothetical protein n=1 Tax=Streptomyces violaceusniger TaxID=68280 RepID=UPI0036AECA74
MASLFMDVVPITAFVTSALTGVISAGVQIAGASLTALALGAKRTAAARTVTKPGGTVSDAGEKKSASATAGR